MKTEFRDYFILISNYLNILYDNDFIEFDYQDNTRGRKLVYNNEYNIEINLPTYPNMFADIIYKSVQKDIIITKKLDIRKTKEDTNKDINKIIEFINFINDLNKPIK